MAHLQLAHAGEGNRTDAPIQPGQLVVHQLQRLVDRPDLIVTGQAHQLPALARSLADQHHHGRLAHALQGQARSRALASLRQVQAGMVVRVARLGLDLVRLGQRAQQAVDLAGRRRIASLGRDYPAAAAALDADRRQIAVANLQRTHLLEMPGQHRQQQLPSGLLRHLGRALQPGEQATQSQRDQQQNQQCGTTHDDLLKPDGGGTATAR
ncbi:hypothetical protein D3C81_1408370 [compost metagenome]